MRETMCNWDRKPGLCRVGKGAAYSTVPQRQDLSATCRLLHPPFALEKKRMNQVSK